MIFKKVYDLTGLDPNAVTSLSSAKSKDDGIFCSKLTEGIPNYIVAPCENVISGENNSWIVLGRDRNASRSSGYGGAGHTHCGMIDLVAGRLGSDARQVDEGGNQMWVDSSFKKDAARIYLSQKTDVDANFGLAKGNVGISTARSAVAMKADGIRIIGREGIKLVTRTDTQNSQGGDQLDIYGVDLIAGNDDTGLQPMVLGKNLIGALELVEKQLSDLSGIINNFLIAQMKYNTEIAGHFHTSPFFALPTLPSEVLVPEGARAGMDMLNKCVRQVLMFKYNLGNFNMNYLNPAGKLFIGSRFHALN